MADIVLFIFLRDRGEMQCELLPQVGVGVCEHSLGLI